MPIFAFAASVLLAALILIGMIAVFTLWLTGETTIHYPDSYIIIEPLPLLATLMISEILALILAAYLARHAFH